MYLCVWVVWLVLFGGSLEGSLSLFHTFCWNSRMGQCVVLLKGVYQSLMFSRGPTWGNLMITKYLTNPLDSQHLTFPRHWTNCTAQRANIVMHALAVYMIVCFYVRSAGEIKLLELKWDIKNSRGTHMKRNDKTRRSVLKISGYTMEGSQCKMKREVSYNNGFRSDKDISLLCLCVCCVVWKY